MLNQFLKTQLLIGKKSIEKLQNSKVIVFGIGGVGGYVVEALVRSGIGKIDIVDNDTVNITNLNRQIIALNSTLGKYKVDVMENRILDINPQTKVEKYKIFYTHETKNSFDFSKYDYVVDAIDYLDGKISLIEECYRTKTPIISSMGAGSKMNPTMLEVEDIYKTSICPLARVVRQELKKRKIPSLKVIYSKEKPIKITEEISEISTKKSTFGSCAFVPSVAGLIIASEVVKDLIK